MDYFILVFQMAWFFTPVAFANMAPVFMQGHLGWLAVPVDFNKTLGGRALFGSHKTWRGLISATLAGGLAFIVQYLLALEYPMIRDSFPFDITQGPWWFGFLFGFAAIAGDLLKSFFKRRVDIDPGISWFPFDQIDLYVLSLLLASFFYPVTGVMAVIVLAFGMIAHILVNFIGYHLGWKDSPW